MIIMFCGPDCCGKDSLMHELSKTYNYNYYMSPRSPICNIVYDRIYDRVKVETTHFTTIKKLLQMGAYFVYVDVVPDILWARAQAKHEPHIDSIQTFKAHIRIYEKVIAECKEKFDNYVHRFIRINNSGDLVIATKKLKSKIAKMREND